MPSAAEVLAALTAVSNRFVAVAIVWHVVVLAALVALLTKRWRPTARTSVLVLTAPLGSVAVASAVGGVVFNAAVFGAATLVLLILALRARERTIAASPVAAAIGIGAIVLGLTYPHFLTAKTSLEYLYAAPTGIVPCPTSLLTIGFTLVGGGFGARTWSLVLVALGLFYGLVGVLWLGVGLDLALIVAAAALGVEVLRPSLFGLKPRHALLAERRQ